MKKRDMSTRPHQHTHARGGTPMLDKMLELLLQVVVLLLAVAGFTFSFVSCYDLSVHMTQVVFTMLAFVALAFLIFASRKHLLLMACTTLLAALWVFFHARELAQGFVLLVEQVLTPMRLYLPDFLSGLALPQDASDAIGLATAALCALLFPVSMLTGFFTLRRPSVTGAVLATLPLLLPAPFYLLAPAVVPAFCLLGAYFTLAALVSIRRHKTAASPGGGVSAFACRESELVQQRSVRYGLTLIMPLLIALSALLSSWILPAQSYVRPEMVEQLQQRILSLDIVDILGRSNDGLTHGNLRALSSIYYTGDTALKVRLSAMQPLYLRDFAGVTLSDNSWNAAPDTLYNALTAELSGVAPQNMHALAAGAGNAPLDAYTLDIQNVAALKTSFFTPNGLVTRAEELEGAVYRQDTALTASRASGAKRYSITAQPCKTSIAPVALTGDNSLHSAYRAAAGSALGLPDATGAEAARMQSAASAYIDYLFTAYTALPAKTQSAALSLCQTHGLSLQANDGTADVFDTCRTLYQLFSKTCSYSYAPPRIPDDADFATYFLTQSRAGYCVHFATTATVLLRALGIPARYAEGYILVTPDFSNPVDAEGFIDIDDTHAHAWVEVFDPAQLEWIPVEMTPGNGANTSSATNGDENAGASPAPESTPTPTPTPTPEATPDANPSASDFPETTPQPEDIAPSPSPETDGAAALPQATPTPRPGADGAGADGSDASAPNVQLPRFVKWTLLIFSAITLVVAAVREGVRALRKKRLAQNDRNAAILYGCKLVHKMLRIASLRPMQPWELPEDYTAFAKQALPGLDDARLLTLTKMAQRVRFGGIVYGKQALAEAVGCVIAQHAALSACLAWPRRALLWLCFPLLQGRVQKTTRRKGRRA